jgi:hypothetical protein
MWSSPTSPTDNFGAPTRLVEAQCRYRHQLDSTLERRAGRRVADPRGGASRESLLEVPALEATRRGSTVRGADARWCTRRRRPPRRRCWPHRRDQQRRREARDSRPTRRRKRLPPVPRPRAALWPPPHGSWSSRRRTRTGNRRARTPCLRNGSSPWPARVALNEPRRVGANRVCEALVEAVPHGGEHHARLDARADEALGRRSLAPLDVERALALGLGS